MQATKSDVPDPGAKIDAKYEVWVSRQAAGGAPGTSTYSPTFNEVLRRVIVRRTPD